MATTFRGWVFFLGLAGLTAQAASDSSRPGSIRLVDDRRQAIERNLEACFQMGLETLCSPVLPGQDLVLPDDVQSLRLEGPEHGPVSVRRGDLLLGQDGGADSLVVPRKALLAVEGLPDEPLTVSLYRIDDPSFRTPAFRSRLSGTDGLRIPAGELLASLSSGRRSPDLHRLSAPPGSRVRLRYRARDGWALVLRVQEAATGRPMSDAAAVLARTEGYGQEDQVLAEGRAGKEGLVLFSGLAAPMAGVTVRHPERVSRQIRGLAATPGTFTFRAVDLERGGRARARITRKGHPVAEAGCALLEISEEAVDPSAAPARLYEGLSDRQGLCRTGPVPPGTYTFRASPPESRSFTDRLAVIAGGEEAELDIVLEAITVRGKVLRGGKPATGFKVAILDLDRPRRYSPGGAVAEAVTDEEGGYETLVWASGEYLVRPMAPDGTPVAARKIVTLAAEEETIDFELAAFSFTGRVVDGEGKPIAQAVAALKWKGGMLLARTGADGRFEIPVDEEGAGTLSASKEGFQASEPVEVVASHASPTVTIVLSRNGSLRGVLVSAAGSPVPGGAVMLTSASHGPHALPRVARAVTDSSGSFEIEKVPGSPLRVFRSGPGCPLSSSEIPVGSQDLSLRCPDLPTTLEVVFRDGQGRPIPHAGLLLRQDGAVVPRVILASHLAALGLPAESDGAGRLIIPGLSPGGYDLFLASSSSEITLLAGSPQGYLTSATLAPLATTELEITPEAP